MGDCKDDTLLQESPRRFAYTGLRKKSRLPFCVSTAACGIAVACLLTLSFSTHPTGPNQYLTAKSSDPKFDWKKIRPTANLRWFECFNQFYCARLQVPLDYSRPDDEKAAIALIKYPTKLPANSPKYLGPVLFNPGGPGGSGISLIQSLGPSFQKLLGHEYDIIGFDPRGIGQTTPPVIAIPDQYEQAHWDSRVPPLFNSTSDANARAHAYWQVHGMLVEKHSKRAAQHVSTATVARDMLTITRAHGREKLLYWGFSYGTVLGSTFAAMFPDNIERLIIDGVVDADDYYSTRWMKNLLHTDKGLDFFYDECAKAGPACALHANSSALVQQRVERVLASVKSRPVPVFDGTEYDIIDYSLVKTALFQALYQPFGYLQLVVPALAALEAGDGEKALVLLKAYRKQPLKCNSPFPDNTAIRTETRHAVLCGEGAVVHESVAALEKHFEKLSKTSIFADLWAGQTHVPCSGWKVRAKDRYTGPFVANTSFPMLVIGNTADPVTPITGAWKMAAGFNGSVVLTQNAPGHTSLSATSICTVVLIRQYFRDGTLPKPGTVCEVIDKLFPPANPGVQELPFQGTDDEEIFGVAKSLSTTFQEFQLSQL